MKKDNVIILKRSRRSRSHISLLFSPYEESSSFFIFIYTWIFLILSSFAFFLRSYTQSGSAGEWVCVSGSLSSFIVAATYKYPSALKKRWTISTPTPKKTRKNSNFSHSSLLCSFLVRLFSSWFLYWFSLLRFFSLCELFSRQAIFLLVSGNFRRLDPFCWPVFACIK